jgi:hypothetical protein
MRKRIFIFLMLVTVVACEHFIVIKKDISFNEKMTDQLCVANAIKAVPDVKLLKQYSREDSAVCLAGDCVKKEFYSSYEIRKDAIAEVVVNLTISGKFEIKNYITNARGNRRINKNDPVLINAVAAVSDSLSRLCGVTKKRAI